MAQKNEVVVDSEGGFDELMRSSKIFKTDDVDGLLPYHKDAELVFKKYTKGADEQDFDAIMEVMGLDSGDLQAFSKQEREEILSEIESMARAVVGGADTSTDNFTATMKGELMLVYGNSVPEKKYR